MRKQKSKLNFNKNKKKLSTITGYFVVIALVAGVAYSNFNDRKDNKENFLKVEALQKPQLNEVVLQSEDPVIKKLITDSSSDNRIVEILNNESQYPRELIELLAKNEETIDFVYDYPNREEKSPTNLNIKSNRNIPLYIQWDERWGYSQYGNSMMALSACGPTSLAMVVSGLTNNKDITPDMVAKYAQENDYYENNIGTKWSLFDEGAKKFGVQGLLIGINSSNVINTLKKGHPIIVSVKPGIFTTTGHIMVLTGVTEDGKILLNDPNSIINTEKSWDVDTIVSEAVSMWEMTSTKM